MLHRISMLALASVLGLSQGAFAESSAEPVTLEMVQDHCTNTIINLYPFDQEAAKDVALSNFTLMFGPGGLMEGYAATAGGSNSSSAKQADAIRAAFFDDGRATPWVGFMIKPNTLHASIDRAELWAHGQSQVTRLKGNSPGAMEWPSPRGGQTVNLTFAPDLPNRISQVSYLGPWALMRFLEGAAPKVAGNTLTVRQHLSGRHIGYKMEFAGDVVPFFIQEMAEFECPQ